MDGTDDDIPQLPLDTLRMLDEFRVERDDLKKQFEDLKGQAEDVFQDGTGNLSMEAFAEDWNASQFWYTDETARILAEQLIEGTRAESAIAVVSAPSVYIQLRNILSEGHGPVRPRLSLLEYDKRFEVFGPDFVPYDFQHPLRLPPELKSKFDRIICDPPFLSEDCQVKTALTVRFLAQNWVSSTQSAEGLRLISCTGERMETTIAKLYGNIGARTTTFEPEHSKGLSNEFRCYANFESDAWTWR